MSPKHIRFPDGITIKHGPAPVFARYFLKVDRFFRERGVRLTMRYDFDELLRLNKEETALGRWFPMPAAFDPSRNDLSEDNCFWISGANAAGETIIVVAVRLYRWPDSCLAAHAVELVYGDRGEKGPCIIDCPPAYEVAGTVSFSGAAWIRPDYRRHGFSGKLAQVGRCYAYVSWGPDWLTSLIKREHVEVGIPQAYGHSRVTFGLRYPGSPVGDLDVALTQQHGSELVAMAAAFEAPPRAANVA